jgi:hypothetical protein
MPVPQITVMLTPGTGATPVHLEQLLSQETGATLSMLIEDPTGTNNFMTGDISLKGYDAPNGTTVRNYFAGITALSKDYTVFIAMSLVPPGGTLQALDVNFNGYVAPNTLQFEPRTGAFSFTVFGSSRALQTTSAATLFQRPGYPVFPATGFAPGYDSKWGLYAAASSLEKLNPTIQIARIDGVAQATPDFYRDDQIQILSGDKCTVVSVTPDSATSPPVFWTLGLAAPLTKNYGGGAPWNMIVHLLTPYQRGINLHDMVATLFQAAGFNLEQYFFSAPLPNLTGLFASPMNTAGLPGAYGVGIAAAVELAGAQIAISQPGGGYLAAGPTTGFTLFNSGAGYRQPPQDATRYGTATTMFGVTRTRTPGSNPEYGLTVIMKFYGYDHLAGNKRYVLTVTCDANIDGTVFPIVTSMDVETASAGWIWGGTTPVPGIGISTTSSTDLSAFYDGIGIDVDPATGTVFFTDIQLTGAAGSAVTMNVSSYQPGGAGYVANRQTGLNGPIMMIGAGTCVVFQVDGLLGKNPTAQGFTLSAPGVMTPVVTGQISPYTVGRSLKFNTGDGRYYAFISDPVQGVSLVSSTSAVLTGNSLIITAIAPPPPKSATPLNLFNAPYDVDLAVQYGVSNGLGVACPMFGLIGGTPVFISNTGSGFIDYADMTGFAVSDALQQLTPLNAGVFYLSMTDRWNFRSRSTPLSTNPIGINDQIDGDPGLLNVVVQPVYNQWTGYVSFANENDKTIFGDTSDIPGSIAYASANTASGQSSYSLELTSRFITSSSLATALAHSLYNYLGAQKRWIEVNRFRDGRVYEVGRTFHCNVDGVNRQFQIIESDFPICDVTVKVVGLEV